MTRLGDLFPFGQLFRDCRYIIFLPKSPETVDNFLGNLMQHKFDVNCHLKCLNLKFFAVCNSAKTFNDVISFKVVSRALRNVDRRRNHEAGDSSPNDVTATTFDVEINGCDL